MGIRIGHGMAHGVERGLCVVGRGRREDWWAVHTGGAREMQMRHGRVHDDEEEKKRASCLTMDIYISTIWMGSNAFRRELSIDYVCILVTVAVFLANIFCTSSDSSLLTEHYKGNIKEELQWN